MHQLPIIMRRILSGGQSGVERAALDAAQRFGIQAGGYCPKGRLAEDGIIPQDYPMIELASSEPHQWCEKNVLASYGTLILTDGELANSSRLTRDFCLLHDRPVLVVHLDRQQTVPPERVVIWLRDRLISILNVTGPRESEVPGGIYRVSYDYLELLFQAIEVDARSTAPLWNCYAHSDM